jgi:hypothetical protein
LKNVESEAKDCGCSEDYRLRLVLLLSHMHHAQGRQRDLLFALVSLFFAGAVAIWQTWHSAIIVSGVVFAVVVVSAVLLRRLRSFHTQARANARLCGWYERATARLDGKWYGQGSSGDDFTRKEHPYEADLNILGPGSLFELLATTRSAAGAERLAAYLLDPTDIATVRARQAAVSELLPQTKLRESVALAGSYAFQECDPGALRDWLKQPVFEVAAIIPPLLCLSSACSLVLGILAFAGLLTWHCVFPFLLPPLVIQAILGLVFMRRVRPVLESVSSLAGEFSVLKDGLAVMVSHTFQSEKLSALVESIGRDAVSHMNALQRLLGACEQRRKDVLYQFSFFLCLGTQLALAIERWRRRFGSDLLQWLNAWAEFEAMNAIACYAFEHPDHVFPEIVEAGAPYLHIRNLGHPLLPASTCVTNDLYLDSATAFCLVSGSNMAGKSTWLRAVGVAAVLAAAGAPVRATSARMSLFTVCASISIVDSLASGTSKFLAEVERLRITIRAAQHLPPVLFLVDEILSGTNSADRRQVAESVLDALVSAGAVGLLSTHDSTLIPLAELPRLRGRILHMGSENPDDPLDFDYRLKPGPVRHTNALAISRMMNIPIVNVVTVAATDTPLVR